jgi:hypothetical protein
LLLPAVQKVRDAAKRTQCSNNLKQIMLATHNFSNTYGKVPVGENWSSAAHAYPTISGADIVAQDGLNGSGTWLGHLLPFVEQGNLYNAAAGDLQTVYNGKQVRAYPVKIFLCPADPSDWTEYGKPQGINNDGSASTNYMGNALIYNPLGTKEVSSAMPDGTSNTVAIAEAYQNCGNHSAGPAWGGIWPDPGWAIPLFSPHGDYNLGGEPFYSYGTVTFQVNPAPAACTYQVLQSGHTAVMQVAMGDGSVRGVSPSISLTTWVNACTPNDGNPLGSDW